MAPGEPAWRPIVEQVHRENQRPLLAFIRAKHVREPKEVLHQAFFEVCRKLEAGELPPVAEDISRMVRNIVANMICNEHRYQRSHPSAKGDEVVPAMQPDQEQSLVLAERKQAVHEGLRALPEPQRALIQAVDLDEEPQAEVAAKLKISVNALWTRLSRARARLRDKLGPHGKDPKG